MLTTELQVEIEILYRQGKGVRKIARETALSRNMIRGILRGEHDGQYGPRKPRQTKLDEHKDYLRDRLEQAGAIRLNATLLLREARARGYDGGVTQFKEYLGSIRPQRPAEPIVRFETDLGKQLQIDFFDFRRGVLPLRAFTSDRTTLRARIGLDPSNLPFAQWDTTFAGDATMTAAMLDRLHASCARRDEQRR